MRTPCLQGSVPVSAGEPYFLQAIFTFLSAVAMHLATAKPPPKPSSGADSAKTKPKGPRKSNPRRAQWNSDDDDGDFIASDQDDNAGKQATHVSPGILDCSLHILANGLNFLQPQRLKSSASSGDSAQLLYAKLQDKRETLISAQVRFRALQPLLWAILTDYESAAGTRSSDNR